MAARLRRGAVALCLVHASCGAHGSPSAPAPTFTDVTSATGVTFRNLTGRPDKQTILEANGGGVCLLDHDADGDPDVFLVNATGWPPGGQRDGPSDALYENGMEWQFRDVTSQVGIRESAFGTGAVAADHDDDGDTDLYVTNYGPNALWHNEGDGTFEDVAAAAGVVDPGWSTGAAFGDVDRDGDLDLYVAHYLEFDVDAPPPAHCRFLGQTVFCGPQGLHGEADRFFSNRGDGTFQEATRSAGLEIAVARPGFTSVFSDLDDDGDLDLLVANDSTPNSYFVNSGNGTFREAGLETGLALPETGTSQAGMGIAVGDYDGDGFQDVFVTTFAQDHDTLYRNLGGGGPFSFEDESNDANVAFASMPFVAWGTGFFDCDGDTDLDLFVANGHVYPQMDGQAGSAPYLQRSFLHLNDGRGRFEESGLSLAGGLVTPRSSRGAAFGDLDNDGDIDIVINNIDDAPTFLRNDMGSAHWLLVKLVGSESNRDGIGAKVLVTAAGRTQLRERRAGESFCSSNDPRLHFGLGSARRVERLEVRWPSGRATRLEGLDADRLVTIVEGEANPRVVALAPPAEPR